MSIFYPNEVVIDIFKFCTRNELGQIQVVNSHWDELIKRSSVLPLNLFTSLKILCKDDDAGPTKHYFILTYQERHKIYLDEEKLSNDEKIVAMAKSLKYGVIELFKVESGDFSKNIEMLQLLRDMVEKNINVINFKAGKGCLFLDYVHILENYIRLEKAEFYLDKNNSLGLTPFDNLKQTFNTKFIYDVSKYHELEEFLMLDSGFPYEIEINGEFRVEIDLSRLLNKILEIYEKANDPWQKFRKISLTKFLVNRERHQLDSFLNEKKLECSIQSNGWVRSVHFYKKLAKQCNLLFQIEFIEHHCSCFGLCGNFIVQKSSMKKLSLELAKE